ncbi:MAG: MATE family efflux transporter [Oscillospiraceae bacterium]|nr:MATE family efflux transporter [Oscillospiraceae bacterium]
MQRDMTTGKEWKHILFFAVPVMLGNIIQQLYSIFDGIVVGNFVSEEALSSISTSAPLIILFLALSIGLAMGSGIIVSQKFGAKQLDDMRATVSTVLLLGTVTGVFLSAVGFVLTPILLRHMLGVPPEILDMAILYLRTIAASLVFLFIFNTIASILRAIGNAKVTLYFLIATTVFNVILTLFAVVIMGWGVAGAGVSTLLSKMFSAVIAYIYMVKKYEYLRPVRAFDILVCKRALRLSLPIGVQHSVLAIAYMAMGRLVNSFEVFGIASYAVAMRIDGFVFIIMLSFNNSMTTFAGQNIGAGRLDRVKKGFVQTQGMATGAGIVMAAGLFIFAPVLVGLFGLTGEAMARSVEQIRFVAPWLILLTPSLIVNGTLKGAGDVMFPTVATTLDLIVRVGLAYAFVYWGVLGYSAAWVTMPVGWALLLPLTLWRYHSGKWKTMRV